MKSLAYEFLWMLVNEIRIQKSVDDLRIWPDHGFSKIVFPTITQNTCFALIFVCVCVREREQATSLWLSTAARQKEQIDQRRTKHYVPESSLEKGEWAPRGGNLCSYSSGTLNWSSHLDYIIRGVIGLEPALCSQVYFSFYFYARGLILLLIVSIQHRVDLQHK